uniref:hypothetical protein n=1 Tax=Navicula avium TaxID=2018708 RepID=UPI0021821B87|nr:hypothetical protein N4L39_pgp045 [Haslea avium]UVG41474.1 hypothetical protein [Haslea avium]
MLKRINYVFNPDRFFELNQKRKNQELSNSEREELSNYNEQYFYYLCLNQKSIFLDLIEKFVNDEIDCDDFSIEFDDLWRTNQKLLVLPSLKTLKKVKINPDSGYFTLLLDNIVVLIDLYDLSIDDDDSAEIRLKNKVSKEYSFFLNFDSAIDTTIQSDSLLKNSVIDKNESQNHFYQIIIFLIIIFVIYYISEPETFYQFFKQV